jgi:hypothetical protein
MRSQLSTLTSADIQRFERDGYVVISRRAGDMVFCHPVMVHCVAPNRGTRPRFMRIKTQVLTHEGRELRDRQ